MQYWAIYNNLVSTLFLCTGERVVVFVCLFFQPIHLNLNLLQIDLSAFELRKD